MNSKETVELRREMYAAVSAGDLEKVKRLLTDHPELRARGGLGATWLHDAAGLGNVAMVEMLVDLGMDVNAVGGKNPDGPVGWCLDGGYVDVARLLLARGASPNVGRLLIGALNAKTNQFELVKLLLEHGADVNRCWRFGDEEKGPLFNALSWAINKGRDDIANYLRAHSAVMPGEEVPQPASSAADEIVTFFEQRFGKADREVLREIVPTSAAGVRIHRVGPVAGRQSQVLFTTGMSAQAMNAPPGGEEYRYSELLIELPAEWPLSREALANPDHRWPIDWLRKVAEYPFQESTWLGGPFAIMSNGNPPVRFSPQCGFAAMLILKSYEDVGPIKLKDGKLVQIYTLIPLYLEEKELEQREDLPQLFRRLDQFKVARMVDVNRPNVAALGSGGGRRGLP